MPTRTCPDCDGAGRVLDVQEKDRPYGLMLECSRCNGCGEVLVTEVDDDE